MSIPLSDAQPYSEQVLPLQGVAFGLLLVLVDIDVAGRDLAPDWAGWLVALLAVHRLARTDGSFAVAESLAFVATVASAATWLVPPHQDSVAASMGMGLVGTAFYLAVSLGVRNRARVASDPATMEFAQRVAAGSTAVLAAVAAGIVVLGGAGQLDAASFSGPVAVVALGVLIVDLVVVVSLVTLLLTRAHASYLTGPRPEPAGA